jgi:protoporphyrin/coproporphyrin ferrochelatase
MAAYDALLLVSFGGPEGRDDVVPFLRNVTRGRDIPDERLRVVGQHYFHFDGVSPINAQNRSLLAAIEHAGRGRGMDLPVYWGNRNWDPTLGEVVAQMSADGVGRALAFFTSAFSSYSGCRQYRENLADALSGADAGHLLIDRIGPYWNHAGFLEPFVDATVAAVGEIPEPLRRAARLLFSTHSLPLQLAETSGAHGGAYVAEHRRAAGWVAEQVRERTGVDRAWELVFQSRSGAPHQPWLEPDVGDRAVELHAAGVPAVVVVPLGFVSDHMEVRWDLDVQARQQAEAVGLAYSRAATPGCDPRFVDMVLALVQERLDDVPVDQRVRVLPPAAPDRCAPGCCPNPRALHAAIGGSDPAPAPPERP